MDRIPRSEFERRIGEFDELVFRAPDIDRFCSSSHWILPFRQAFTPDSPMRTWRGEHGWVALAETRTEGGAVVLHALESMWCQACPVPAVDPEAHARDVARLLRAHEIAWDVLLLGGLKQGSPLYDALGPLLTQRHRILLGGHCSRQLCDLSAGVDAFLERRTPNFRRSLRRAEQRAAEAGLEWEEVRTRDAARARELHERTLAVERESWKGLEGVGAAEGPMCEFYGAMMPRLAEAGMLRLLFGRIGGEDVSYLLGAVSQGRFRGLQFSYLADRAQLSLGNLGQLEMMRRVAAEGVHTWDLGSEVPYKRRWSDRSEDTVSLAVLRR